MCKIASREGGKTESQARQARQHTHSKHLLCREVTVLLRVVRALAVARVLTLAVWTHEGYVLWTHEMSYHMKVIL